MYAALGMQVLDEAVMEEGLEHLTSKLYEMSKAVRVIARKKEDKVTCAFSWAQSSCTIVRVGQRNHMLNDTIQTSCNGSLNCTCAEYVR